jgi:hypothetical protein
MGEDDARAPETDLDDLRLAFRPSRIASLRSQAALFALPVIAAVAGCANSSPGTVTRTVSPASSRSAARTQAGAVCAGAQLSGKVSRAGSQSSAPFAEIVLTNRGPGSCQLSGYPQLTVWGPTGHGPSAFVKTVLTRGSTYEIPDAGPRTVVILPGRSAWFTIGTGTAYGSPNRRVRASGHRRWLHGRRGGQPRQCRPQHGRDFAAGKGHPGHRQRLCGRSPPAAVKP